jgi:hypothetical protein
MKKTALLILPIIFLATPSLSNAQGIKTTVVPPRVDLIADPGQTLTTDLKVINDTDSVQYYSVAVDDFIVTDNKGTPIPVSSTVSGRWSLKSWIYTPNVVPVDPHESQIVKVSINVPKNAYPGGHYAMVTYQPNGDTKPGEMKKTGALVAHRTGTLVYVTVNGPITQNAIIKNFTTTKFNEFGPVTFTGLIENQSETHIAPTGSIIIKDMMGQKVATIPVETGNIFPDVSREFSSIWNQKWGYGRYQATLNMTYGTAGGFLTATIFFWLFPIRLIITILIAIISILTIIILMGKRNRRHQQELESEVSKLKKEISDLEHSQK